MVAQLATLVYPVLLTSHWIGSSATIVRVEQDVLADSPPVVRNYGHAGWDVKFHGGAENNQDLSGEPPFCLWDL
jgi:hypothetical protein